MHILCSSRRCCDNSRNRDNPPMTVANASSQYLGMTKADRSPDSDPLGRGTFIRLYHHLKMDMGERNRWTKHLIWTISGEWMLSNGAEQFPIISGNWLPQYLSERCGWLRPAAQEMCTKQDGNGQTLSAGICGCVRNQVQYLPSSYLAPQDWQQGTSRLTEIPAFIAWRKLTENLSNASWGLSKLIIPSSLLPLISSLLRPFSFLPSLLAFPPDLPSWDQYSVSS